MYSKILIPLDGSQTAEQVLPYTRWLAANLEIPIELLSAIDIAELAAHMSAEKAGYLNNIVEEGSRQSLEYLRGIATTFSSGGVNCSIERGHR